MIPIYQVHPCWLFIISKHREKFKSINLDFSYSYISQLLNNLSIDVMSVRAVVFNNGPEFPAQHNHYLNDKLNSLPVNNFLFKHNAEKANKISKCSNIEIKNYYSLEHWKQQGVMVINLSITPYHYPSEIEQEYWYDFISDIVKLISIMNPTIWLFHNMIFTSNMNGYLQHIKKSIKLESYVGIKEEQGSVFGLLNKDIPIYEDANYILNTSLPNEMLFEEGICFDLFNQLLTLQRQPLIEW